jgi:hypothetical protein
MQAQARICPTCKDDHWPDRPCTAHDLKDRIAKLERVIVWAARNYAATVDYARPVVCLGHQWYRKSVEFDGTDAGILAAFERAEEEAKGLDDDPS